MPVPVPETDPLAVPVVVWELVGVVVCVGEGVCEAVTLSLAATLELAVVAAV